MTKPGIIRGNLLAVTAGYCFASGTSFDLAVLLAVLAGTTCVIAAACVWNNIIDRSIDGRMERTKKRALVVGSVSLPAARRFALLLGLLGFGILWGFTHPLVVIAGMLGFLDYVLVYGYAKRKSVHGTLIGGVSGAIPPLAGVVAVSQRIDATAVLVFLAMMAWQMPHFFALALARKQDYAAAGLPVLPVLRNERIVQRQSIVYAAIFGVCALLLVPFAKAGFVYGATVSVSTGYWLIILSRSAEGDRAQVWAQKGFRVSLLVLLSWCAVLITNAWLP